MHAGSDLESGDVLRGTMARGARGKEASKRHKEQRERDPAVLKRRAEFVHREVHEARTELHEARTELLETRAELELARDALETVKRELAVAQADEEARSAAASGAAGVASLSRDAVAFVFSLSIAADLRLRVLVAGGWERLSVVDAIGRGLKTVVLGDDEVAGEARSVRCALHALVMAFDAIASAARLGLHFTDPFDAAVALVDKALSSKAPVLLDGAPSAVYVHTASKIHARMPTAAQKGRQAMLWSTTSAARVQPKRSWLDDCDVQSSFPLIFLGTAQWQEPDVQAAARQMTGASGVGRICILKTIPLSSFS